MTAVKLIKARILFAITFAGIELKPDTLVQSTKAVIEGLKKDGSADDATGAVKYCEHDLGLEAITLPDAKEVAEQERMAELEAKKLAFASKIYSTEKDLETAQGENKTVLEGRLAEYRAELKGL